jgi:prepilin peptidase CpaA
MLAAAIFVIFPFCMAYAAVSDMLSMTIANRVSLLLVASFMVIAPMTGMDWQTYGMHLAAGFAVLTVTFTLFATGAMGGGDAKLLAATSVWMGYDIVLLQYLVTAGFVGGMLTLAIMSYRGSVLAVFTAAQQDAAQFRRFQSRHSIWNWPRHCRLDGLSRQRPDEVGRCGRFRRIDANPIPNRRRRRKSMRRRFPFREDECVSRQSSINHDCKACVNLVLTIGGPLSGTFEWNGLRGRHGSVETDYSRGSGHRGRRRRLCRKEHDGSSPADADEPGASRASR